jgi:uncharacterized membrane protein
MQVIEVIVAVGGFAYLRLFREHYARKVVLLLLIVVTIVYLPIRVYLGHDLQFLHGVWVGILLEALSAERPPGSTSSTAAPG